MKTINVTFTDKEFNQLSKTKTKHACWHQFIMSLVRKKMKGGKDGRNNNK